jgi:hypothetical protein
MMPLSFWRLPSVVSRFGFEQTSKSFGHCGADVKATGDLDEARQRDPPVGFSPSDKSDRSDRFDPGRATRQ